jgi:hypothetical protein
METYIALLRAVNVGGTGKLPMAELRAMCEDAGFRDVRTYIASGNVVFRSAKRVAGVKACAGQVGGRGILPRGATEWQPWVCVTKGPMPDGRFYFGNAGILPRRATEWQPSACVTKASLW